MSVQDQTPDDVQTVLPPVDPDDPRIVARDVSLKEYMRHYAGHHYEWIEGFVIQMSPAGLKHNNLIYYLHSLFRAYFAMRPIGSVLGQPYTLKLPDVPARRREPDLLVVLNDSDSTVHETYIDGPPDICIEILSPGTEHTDRGAKFSEYEIGGVPEYWIIDPMRQEALFYVRGDNGLYARRSDEDGRFASPTLADFVLDISVLWQDKLPGTLAAGMAVKKMLESNT